MTDKNSNYIMNINRQKFNEFILIKIRANYGGVYMNIDSISKLKDVLPEVAGISGKDEHFNSAILVPLININDELHFLFEKRSSNIRQAGEICFPGGKYDKVKDKDFEETAIRETIEEIGIDREKIKIIGKLDMVIASMGTIVDGFVGELKINSIEELNINKDEVEKIFTVPVSYFQKKLPEKYKVAIKVASTIIDEDGKEVIIFPAKQLGLPKMYHSTWGNSKNNILVYKASGEVIWGITARFIYDIVNKLRSIHE